MDTEHGDDVQSTTVVAEKVKKPALYRVIMHNDDYTTMEFVVEILISIFKKEAQEAAILTNKIHRSGQATVGIYAYDIAVTRVQRAHERAKKNDFPLLCTIIEDGAPS